MRGGASSNSVSALVCAKGHPESMSSGAGAGGAGSKKLGSVGRPLPGSPEVAVAAWSSEADDFVRDGAGHLLHARLDEPGMLIARLAPSADLAYVDARRLVTLYAKAHPRA